MARRQSEILGLFTTPTQVRQMEQQQLAQQANVYSDPIARQLFTSGAQIAGGVGRLFGAMSPQEMEAQTVQTLQQEVPFDPENQSTYYNTLAQRLIDQGMYGSGYQALELANQARATELERKQQTQDQDPARMSLAELTGISANVLQNYPADAVRKANQIRLQGPLEGENMSTFIGRVNEALGQSESNTALTDVLSSVPFDPNDQAAYFTNVANQLINSGDPALIREGYKYLEQANKATKRASAGNAPIDLDVGTRTAILEEDTASQDALSRANTSKRLAAQYEQIKPVGGTPAQIREASLRVIGGEDEISMLREEVSALAASRALSRVPPGPASDKDILFAQRGFPSEFTNAETMAKFLRGFAKMEALKAAYHNHRANFLATNPSAAGHAEEWRTYRNENMAEILEEYGFTFNTETLDQEVSKQSESAPSRVNAADDFSTLSRDSAVDVAPRPPTRRGGGRSQAARR